jgi:hypothetical protein
MNKEAQNFNAFSVALKGLSSEMDLAQSSLIRQLFIKGRGAEVFRKNGLSPIL